MTTKAGRAVCDTGPVIHLDELNCLDLLADFDEIILVPKVAEKVAQIRPSVLAKEVVRFIVLRDVVAVDEELQSMCRGFSLDPGEAEALAFMRQSRNSLFLTDDAAARLVAEQMGLRVHGTVGVLVRSIRRGQRKPEAILAIMEEIPVKSSLHIKHSLLDEIKGSIRNEFGIARR